MMQSMLRPVIKVFLNEVCFWTSMGIIGELAKVGV